MKSTSFETAQRFCLFDKQNNLIMSYTFTVDTRVKYLFMSVSMCPIQPMAFSVIEASSSYLELWVYLNSCNIMLYLKKQHLYKIQIEFMSMPIQCM